jgi:hypothetical protein
VYKPPVFTGGYDSEVGGEEHELQGIIGIG